MLIVELNNKCTPSFMLLEKLRLPNSCTHIAMATIQTTGQLTKREIWWNPEQCVSCEVTSVPLACHHVQKKISSHVSTTVHLHSPPLFSLPTSHLTCIRRLCPQMQRSVSCSSWEAERTVARQTAFTRLTDSRNLLNQNSLHVSFTGRNQQCLCLLIH